MISFAIQRLKYQIDNFPGKFLKLPDQDTSDNSFPNKWSKKEVLGHLIDSATNNHHRFIKSCLEPGIIKVTPYDQNVWVSINNYKNIPREEILTFWVAYNKHLLRFISTIPESKLNNKFDIGGRELVTMAFLINDYAEHLEHHINQILSS